MTILGIDPGIANTGWGVIDIQGQKFRPVSYGTVKTQPSERLEERIAKIAEDVAEIATAYKVDCVSMEDIFFNRNVSSAIGVAKVIGAICHSMFQKGISVTVYTPMQFKLAVTGYGMAEKAQVQEMTRIILGLEKIPRPNHAADALAAAVCHANMSATQSRMAEKK